MTADQPAAPTPEQRAHALTQMMRYENERRRKVHANRITAAIRDAESAARADEREACAREAEAVAAHCRAQSVPYPGGEPDRSWLRAADAADDIGAGIRALATEETSRGP